MSQFGMHHTVHGGFDEAVKKVTEALASEGFGVLTEIDIQATLHKKLGVELRPYRILGACNPPLAHRALQSHPDVGVMLPCNVAVYEREPGLQEVVAVDPMTTIAGHDAPGPLQEIAAEVRAKLQRALAALG